MGQTAPGRALRCYCLIRDALIADRDLRRTPALRELLITVAWEWSQGRAMTIKHCILSYAGAEKIVRKNIRTLLDAGYVETFRSERDRRERLLKPTAFTLDRLQRIETFLNTQDANAPPLQRRRSDDIGYEPPAYLDPPAAKLEL